MQLKELSFIFLLNVIKTHLHTEFDHTQFVKSLIQGKQWMHTTRLLFVIYCKK